jgi:hypothetical protein
MKLNIPSWATTILSLIAGGLAILNQVSFGFGSPWGVYVTLALVALAGLGISPLVGAQFRSALHLSHSASLVITSIVTTAGVAVTTLSISPTAKGIVVGILAFLAGVGFAPGPQPAPAPAPTPAPAA